MTRLYRTLLRLYPPAFRVRYEASLLEAFECERADPRHRGILGGASLWRFLLADLLATMWRLRGVPLLRRLRVWHAGGVPRLPNPSRRGLMETLAQDVRYSLRQFVRRPGFAAVAVLSLALAIGGNSVIFGMLDGFVFNPFPYPDADRLVAVGPTYPKVSTETRYIEVLSPAEYGDIRVARSFSAVGAFDLGNRNVSGGDVPERVFTALLLDDLFPVIGMRPHLGRGFTSEELAPKGPPAAIISHRLWQSRFGADPGIIGRGIRIGGEATTVVGVMPPGLVLIGTDLWIPWGADTAQMPRGARQFSILGRLAPGVSLAEANAELATIARQVEQTHLAAFKEYEGWRLTATPIAAAVMQDLRPAAFVLIPAVGFVLLIACANLANMMLARASTRTRDVAVRLALGAGRWRVARQLLIESVLISAAGGAAGLVLAFVGLKYSGTLVPQELEMLGLHAGVNLRVIAWSAALALGAGLLIALIPAWQAAATDPHESLKSESRAGAGRRGVRVRQGLIVAEIALSVVLLLGAGLLVRSFLNMQRVDLGFNPEGVLTMRLTLPAQKYPTGQAMTTFFEQLVERVGQVPGVTTAAMASQFPPDEPFTARIEVEGFEATGTALPTARTTIASKALFTTLGTPLMRGRMFDGRDTPASPPRAIVNTAFVTRYIKDRDPLTTRVRVVGRSGPGPWTEIVGVVGDTRNAGAAAPVAPEVFTPMEQGRNAWSQLFLLVRTQGDAANLLAPVRAAVASLDPEQPVYAVRTLEDAVALSSLQQRIAAMLLGIFAAVALTLAAVGIYGVMAYSVAARTQEIGVRMAVGAERSDVLRLVLGQVVRLAAIGLVLGIGAIAAAGSALESFLFGVTRLDATTIALVTVTLASVAMVAGWIPAKRASNVNPIEALRYE